MKLLIRCPIATCQQGEKMNKKYVVFEIIQFLEEQNIEILPFNEQSFTPILILLVLVKLCLA